MACVCNAACMRIYACLPVLDIHRQTHDIQCHLGQVHIAPHKCWDLQLRKCAQHQTGNHERGDQVCSSALLTGVQTIDQSVASSFCLLVAFCLALRMPTYLSVCMRICAHTHLPHHLASFTLALVICMHPA